MTASPYESRAELDLGNVEVRVELDAPAHAPMSVFGAVMTARDQHEAFEAARPWAYWADVRAAKDEAQLRRRDRDRRLVRAARRWQGQPLRPPLAGRFVPGDVAAMRSAVIEDDLGRRARLPLETMQAGQRIIGTLDERAAALDAVALEWLHAATPYFVGLSTLVGLVDTEIPSPADLAELSLPPATAIYFGGDIAVPMELLEADSALGDLNARMANALAEHPEWLSGDDHPAPLLPAPLLNVARRRPVRVCGVVLHADPSGQLDDLVMWLTVQPDNVDVPRSVIYGWLSRSMLRHVAVDLAAAVGWGQWTVPALGGELGDDPNSREFKEAVRRSWFRKREPAGGALGVRVLDVRRTVSRTTDRGGSHASPVTHRRRRHWRRQRVGPRDDWRYERRLIEPTIVNPGHHPLDEPLTVYRLPLPPPA